MLGETIGSIIYTSSSSSSYLISSTNITIGTTTTPQTRIFHIHLISSATPSNITIQNGNGGVTEVNITGTANKGINFDFGWWGIVFPLGAYITLDGNQNDVIITCKGEDNDVMTGISDSGAFIYDDSGNILYDDNGNPLFVG